MAVHGLHELLCAVQEVPSRQRPRLTLRGVRGHLLNCLGGLSYAMGLLSCEPRWALCHANWRCCRVGGLEGAGGQVARASEDWLELYRLCVSAGVATPRGPVARARVNM